MEPTQIPLDKGWVHLFLFFLSLEMDTSFFLVITPGKESSLSTLDSLKRIFCRPLFWWEPNLPSSDPMLTTLPLHHNAYDNNICNLIRPFPFLLLNVFEYVVKRTSSFTFVYVVLNFTYLEMYLVAVTFLIVTEVEPWLKVVSALGGRDPPRRFACRSQNSELIS